MSPLDENRRASAAQRITRLVFRVFGSIAPGSAARWFERFILTPSRYRTNGKTVSFSGGERIRIPYGNGWVSVWTWGEEGLPVALLLHGWGGQAAHLEEFVAPLVAAGFRVVAFDAPAHGESDGVMTNVVECSGAAIQVAGMMGPVYGIIAHSFGAPTAALAINHGLDVKRLVFIGAPFNFAMLTHRIAELMGFPSAVPDRMQQNVERRLGIPWDDVDMDKLLRHHDIPLLVVHDDEDRDVPFEDSAAIVGGVRDGRLVRTSGLGHRRIVRDSAVVREAVEFLSRER